MKALTGMAATLAACITVACGGGGGGDSAVTPTQTPSPTPAVIPSIEPTDKPAEATPTPVSTVTPLPTALPPPSTTPTVTPSPTPGSASSRAAVEGVIRIVSGTRIDSDTNDTRAPGTSNGTPPTAQWLTNAGRVGGYVAAPGAGENGAVQPAGDQADAFRMQLQAGQWVNLYIGNPGRATGDLDLGLYAEDPELRLVAASTAGGDTATESVQAPEDGEYLVVVIAYADEEAGINSASNYVREVGASPGARHVMNTGADIIPDDVVVQFRESITKSGASSAARATALGLEHRGGAPGRAMRFSLPTTRQKSASVWGQFGLVSDAQQKTLTTLSEIKRLALRDDVESAEPNVRRYVRAEPNDSLYDRQWHYPVINLPDAWDVSTGDPDVLVAVIDTGVLINHPDLSGNLDANDPDGVDFISDTTTANDGDRADSNADDAGDAGNPDGTGSFHGTHVAGTVAAVTNNGSGVAGVCWNCQIMPLRALGVGGGSGFDIVQAVLYAAGLDNDYGIAPAKRADIINMSLGGTGATQFEQSVYNQVRGAGVFVVAAAGNAGTSEQEFPASYDNVISVAAVGPDRLRAPYSQFNAAVDVAAPGGNSQLGREAQVASTLGTGAGSPGDITFGFAYYQGTSMATPHMAGVVALMKSVYPGLTPAQLDAVIADGSIVDDAGTSGRDDQYGFGIINAAKAVQVAQALASGGSVQEVPRLGVSPSSLDFGAVQTSTTVEARNIGTGSLQITGVDPASVPAWLAVIDEGGGTFRLTVDREQIAEGVEQASVIFLSSANSVSLPVTVERMPPEGLLADNAGRHYVILVPLGETQPEQQREVTPVDGQYTFAFSNIPLGDYVLAAGTDMDNDGRLCDAGEACALYPSNGDVRSLRLSGDVSGIEMLTDFQLQFQGAAQAQGARSGGVLPAGGFVLRD